MIVDRTDGTDQITNYSYEYGVYDSGLDVWRNNGRIRRIVDNVDPAFTVDYSYDDYDRLIGAGGGAYTRGYSYDPWGNLRQVWGTGGESPAYSLNYAANGSGAAATIIPGPISALQVGKCHKLQKLLAPKPFDESLTLQSEITFLSTGRATTAVQKVNR